MNITDKLRGNAYVIDTGRVWRDDKILKMIVWEREFRVPGDNLFMPEELKKKEIAYVRYALVGEAWEKLMRIRYLTPLEYGGDVIREVIDLLE